ncbi:glycosyltransferase family 2 protein [Patescibacteria group bacterium]|uniref:Glycosyltransferase family 2 protein n=1 Tax=candidate division WWE3 bacterium TaxID=2053526 RepID=A0A928TV69_UNCKA|nr:glycosyltransferase family 2 protein [candidate division WWE3 bacterium]MCL4732606.1 glycosyltransferase family 2 protein [Patescibacteria group bacterium]MDL1952740.1 glycosyltransferase family 2 protein [Candidatus Uhrbacteria bacterium UHB]RIL01132.1 MAG: hypothetical protein DCC77_01150 [Candidatus Uhrbacteria bacterium]
MEKINASVGILTFNSAATLERALESVKDFEDIIVCDGGSTDGTLEIAQRYGARVIPQDPQATGPHRITDFAAVRNRCLEAARTGWFFYIDSDERAEPELVHEIADIVKQNPPGVRIYKITPRIIYRGRRIEYASSYPGYQTRFFKINPKIHFRKAVHERIEYPSDTEVSILKGHWNYYLSGPEEIMEDVEIRDIPILFRRYQNQPTWKRYRGACKSLISLIVIFLKSFRNLFHPTESMPWSVECAKMRVQFRFFRALLFGSEKKYG